MTIMTEKNYSEESEAKKVQEESKEIDQELLDLIVKNESFKSGIAKLVEEMDKKTNKKLNQ